MKVSVLLYRCTYCVFTLYSSNTNNGLLWLFCHQSHQYHFPLANQCTPSIFHRDTLIGQFSHLVVCPYPQDEHLDPPPFYFLNPSFQGCTARKHRRLHKSWVLSFTRPVCLFKMRISTIYGVTWNR